MKKILAGIMALCICGGVLAPINQVPPPKTVFTAFADVYYTIDPCENFTYTKFSDHVVISDCDEEAEGKIVIPDKIEGLPVTVINYSAFSGCYNLTSITIPDSVTSIGDHAFEGCTSLTSINVSKDNENYSSLDGVLFNKDKTVLLAYPGGKGKEYTIPDSVTEIGWYAFSGCTSLTSITIPDSVTNIGFGAFSGCTNLISINVSNNIKNYSSLDGVLFNKDKTVLLAYPGGKGKEYTIPDSVTEIGWYAFSGCTSLTSITIPDSVTEIGLHAFYGCTSLTSITIPDSVSVINWYAFSGCTSLTSINIPNSVTKIGKNVFYGCSSLPSINIPNSVTKIEESAFYGCSSLTSINIPDSVTEIEYHAFSNCTSLTSINVSKDNENYSSLDGVLFNKDKTELLAYPGGKGKEYTIPDSVTEIRLLAFYGCTSLTSITIPDSVAGIGDRAFFGCTSLTSITIKNPDCIIYGWNYTICNGYDEEKGKYYFNGTIYGYANSTAQEYAEKHGYKFALISNDNVEPPTEKPTDKPNDKPTDKPTDTPTTPDPDTPEIILGDPSGDGVIDSSDASFDLVEYALTSTGGTSKLTDAQKFAADVNKDGTIDASDASSILMFYSYSSTGGTETDMEKWLDSKK